MRTAYEQERKSLAGAAGRTGGALSVLFVYNGGKDVKAARSDFKDVRGDMSSMCQKICAAAARERK